MSEFVVLFDYAGENDGDLELVTGETITVIKKEDHGWWLGAKADDVGNPLGVRGYFPKNYVKAKPPALPPRPAGLGSDLTGKRSELPNAPKGDTQQKDAGEEEEGEDEEEEGNEEGLGRGSIFFDKGDDGHLSFEMSR